MQDTIDSLTERGLPTVLCITGGGSGAINTLLRYGGASSFFLEAQVPYCPESIDQYLGGYTPDQYCCDSTARMLATSAYERACVLTGCSLNTIGVGATSKLGKAGPEREGRKHIVYVAVHGPNKTTTTRMTLGLPRGREYEEALAAQCIVKTYCDHLGVPCLPPPIVEKYDTVEQASASIDWAPFQGIECISPHHNEIGKRPTIFSGSFNPVHPGHIKVAERAYEITHQPVWFEISIRNCSKPMIDWLSIDERVRGLIHHFDNPAIAGVVITHAPLFVDKAAIFHEPTFVVGMDTMERIDNESMYDSRNDYVDAINFLIRSNSQFLAFDRKGTNKPKYFNHAGLNSICTFVNDYRDAGESSTQVRQQHG